MFFITTVAHWLRMSLVILANQRSNWLELNHPRFSALGNAEMIMIKIWMAHLIEMIFWYLTNLILIYSSLLSRYVFLFFFFFFYELIHIGREQIKMQHKQLVYFFHVYKMIKSLLLSFSLKSLSTYDSVSAKQEDVFTYISSICFPLFRNVRPYKKKKCTDDVQ